MKTLRNLREGSFEALVNTAINISEDMIHLQVNYKGSSFHVDFFQLQDPNDYESGRVWEQRVAILETQLHTVGQHLGWYTAQIRAANDPSFSTITENSPTN